MTNNIGCFSVGCNNTVVGQCSGYKGNCGQFYCRDHAAGKLCSECGGRKKRDKKREDYHAAADGISARKPRASMFIVCILVLIGVYTMSDRIGGIGGLLFWITLAAPFAFYAGRRTKKVERAIANTDKIKPGFRKFYQTYEEAKKKEKKENLVLGIAEVIGGAVGGAAQGVGEAINITMDEDRKFREGTPRDVESAIRDLGKKL
jgi:hypothetical protein